MTPAGCATCGAGGYRPGPCQPWCAGVAAAVAAGDAPVHGTTTRYVAGCRCDACRAANTERQRAYRAANKERAAEYQRAYYAANKERVAP